MPLLGALLLNCFFLFKKPCEAVKLNIPSCVRWGILLLSTYSPLLAGCSASTPLTLPRQTEGRAAAEQAHSRQQSKWWIKSLLGESIWVNYSQGILNPSWTLEPTTTEYLGTRVAVGFLLSLLQHPVLFPWLYQSSSLPGQAVNWTSKWPVKKKMNQKKAQTIPKNLIKISPDLLFSQVFFAAYSAPHVELSG